MGGTVKVKDACTLEITKFTYDGAAPAFYFWAAPTKTYATILKSGKRISGLHVTKKYTGQKVSHLTGCVSAGEGGARGPQHGGRRAHPRFCCSPARADHRQAAARHLAEEEPHHRGLVSV